MKQKLITKEVEKRLLKYPLYSQEEVADKAVLVKFFNGPATWIVCEAERRGDNDWMFFGWVDLGFGGEWGYFTFSEMAECRVPLRLRKPDGSVVTIGYTEVERENTEHIGNGYRINMNGELKKKAS